MRKGRLSGAKQSKLIEHFVAGTTARCAAELVVVNRKTAAYYFQRLCEIIAHQLERDFTRSLAVRLRSMSLILVVFVEANAVEVQQARSRYLAC